jgi:hypothetical protein
MTERTIINQTKKDALLPSSSSSPRLSISTTAAPRAPLKTTSTKSRLPITNLISTSSSSSSLNQQDTTSLDNQSLDTSSNTSSQDQSDRNQSSQTYISPSPGTIEKDAEETIDINKSSSTSPSILSLPSTQTIKSDDEIIKRNIKEKNDEELIKVLRADLKEMREMMERSKRDVIDMNNANLMLRKKLEYYNANNSDDEVSESAVSETHTSQSDFENDEEKYNSDVNDQSHRTINKSQSSKSPDDQLSSRRKSSMRTPNAASKKTYRVKIETSDEITPLKNRKEGDSQSSKRDRAVDRQSSPIYEQEEKVKGRRRMYTHRMMTVHQNMNQT